MFCSDLMRSNSQAALCDIEARRLLSAENAQLAAELRLEAAAQRAAELSASKEDAERRFEEQLAELLGKGHEREKELLKQLRAAEEALSQSLRWCEKQNQLGVSLFGALRACFNAGDDFLAVQ